MPGNPIYSIKAHTNLVRGSIKPDVMVKIACKANNQNNHYFGLKGLGIYISKAIRHDANILFLKLTNCDNNGIVVFLKLFLRKITKREQFCFLLCYL